MDTFAMQGDATATRRIGLKLKTETARIYRHTSMVGGRLGSAGKTGKPPTPRGVSAIRLSRGRQTKVTVKSA